MKPHGRIGTTQRVGAALLAGIVLSGCGPGVPTAEVTGRVTFDGTTQAGVLVEFTPSAVIDGKRGPCAYGITDADGRYRAFRTGKNKFGVVTGVNSVRLTAMEGSGAKVHPLHGQASGLTFDVQPGENVFDVDVPIDPTIRPPHKRGPAPAAR